MRRLWSWVQATRGTNRGLILAILLGLGLRAILVYFSGR